MSYDSSTGVISSTKISIDDVRSVLGESSYDLGTLFLSDKVNKWSQKKPVLLKNYLFVDSTTSKVSQINPITSMNVSVPWWYGDLNFVTSGSYSWFTICGIKVPIVHSVNNSTCVSIIDGYSSNGMNWTYLSRTGYPYRLTDFGGYDHNATCPFYYQVDEILYTNSGYGAAYLEMRSEGDNSLTIEPFKEVLDNTWHVGIIVSDNGSYSYYESDEDLLSLSSIGCRILFPAGNSARTLKVYFVLRSISESKTIMLPSTSDYANPLTVTVKSGTNPSSNPFNVQINFNFEDFAYSQNESYYEPLTNVNEGLYTSLCTTSSFCVRAKVSKTTNGSGYLNFGDISFKWGYCGTGGNGTPAYVPYINGSSYSNTGYTFGTADTYVYFLFSNIFYDSATKTTYGYGNKEISDEPLIMYYKSAEQDSVEMDLEYDSSHNGYLHNSKYGYFKSR